MNFGGARSAQHDNKNGQFEIYYIQAHRLYEPSASDLIERHCEKAATGETDYLPFHVRLS
jgi:hypothetical protein